jgi:hypothetical protein
MFGASFFSSGQLGLPLLSALCLLIERTYAAVKRDNFNVDVIRVQCCAVRQGVNLWFQLFSSGASAPIRLYTYKSITLRRCHIKYSEADHLPKGGVT